MVKIHGNHYDPLAKLLGNGKTHFSQGKVVETNIKANHPERFIRYTMDRVSMV